MVHTLLLKTKFNRITYLYQSMQIWKNKQTNKKHPEAKPSDPLSMFPADRSGRPYLAQIKIAEPTVVGNPEYRQNILRYADDVKWLSKVWKLSAEVLHIFISACMQRDHIQSSGVSFFALHELPGEKHLIFTLLCNTPNSSNCTRRSYFTHAPFNSAAAHIRAPE